MSSRIFRHAAAGVCLTALVVGLLAGAVAAGPATYPGQQVVRVWVDQAEQIEEVLGIAEGLWSCQPRLGPLDVRVTPEQRAALERLGYRLDVLVPDVQEAIDRERAGAPRGGGFFSDYHPYSEIVAFLQSLADQRPDLASIFVAGQTVQGRDIVGIKVTGTANRPKTAVLYHGAEHAREWISSTVPPYLAEYLISAYDGDPVIRDLMDRTVFFLIPVMNVDGYEYTWTNDRLWRKNRRNNGGGSYGVDNNRNWGFQWGGEGSSGDPNSEVYRGPAPFSEPETVAIADFLVANDVRAYLDLHSYGQYILWPWGYTTNLPPDNDTFAMLGDEMRQRIAGVHGMSYTPGPIASTLYFASGVSVDWAYGEHGIWALAFELRDTGQSGFLLPPDQIIPQNEEMLPALLFLADWVSTALRIEFPEPLPDLLPPGEPTPVTIRVLPANEPVDPDSVKLYYRYDAQDMFQAVPMVPTGNDLYEGFFPPPRCDDTPQFYFEAASTLGSVVTSPPGAPEVYFTARVGVEEVFFADDFQTDRGWTVENNNLSDGAWERGVPAGDGTRGDPTSDADGSGACYLTGNRSGNSDVDGGPTRLISPRLALAGADADIAYAWWLYNDDGDDSLVVEVSADDGGSWVEARRYTGGGGGWNTDRFRLADYVTPSDQVRVRFSVADNPNNSVTEAAIDAFTAARITCEDSGPPGDFDGDGDVDIADFAFFSACFGGSGIPCSGECCAADLDGDGDVDIADFSTFSANFTGSQ